MNPNSSAGLSNQQDEIDLIELFQGIWAQKWLIADFTAVAVAGAAAFAFLSTPTYEARSEALPPRLGDITGDKLGRIEAKLAVFKVGTFMRCSSATCFPAGSSANFFWAPIYPV